MIYLQDADCTLYQGDALEVLRTLPDESFHMACTSPPFYGLRDYGTGTWEGGDEACDHKHYIRPRTETPGGRGGSMPMQEHVFLQACGKCGARRVDRQIGLEPTPDEWVARLVEVFAEVRRVLRKDGTLWVEIGDSYGANQGSGKDAAGHVPNAWSLHRQSATPIARPYKPKDLLGQPWLLAFAMRADGWFLRSEIIWAKPNPMPESVTDRPTVSHSRVFLFAKSQRYFYDAEAIREPYVPANGGMTAGDYDPPGQPPHSEGRERWPGAGRNRRSVWTITTEPYPDAHFATWPQKLVEPMILAGTSEKGVCPECGAPWARVVEREEPPPNKYAGRYQKPVAEHMQSRGSGGNVDLPRGDYIAPVRTEVGWQPTCDHVAGNKQDGYRPRTPESATVLDPFAGSGTTLYVARRLGRRSIGIELSPEYCELAADRMKQQSLFAGQV